MQAQIQNSRVVELTLKMVAKHYGTTPEALKSDQGNPAAKKVVMHVLKEVLGTTLRTAKEAVGQKYDPAVYSAIKNVKKWLKTDQSLGTLIDEITTEALMITSLGGEDPQSSELVAKESTIPRASVAKIPATPSKAKMVQTSAKDTTQVVTNVEKAVTSVFLGENLLRSNDPTGEITLAKDTVLFIIWSDFQKHSLNEVMNIIHLENVDDFYRSIGRVTVFLKGDEIFRKKVKAVRALLTQE